MMVRKDYSKVYFKCDRIELTQFVHSESNRVLDVGCAEGRFGGLLKESGLAREVIGVEILPEVAKTAQKRLDRVVCANIEGLNFHEAGLEDHSFDYIFCADILEHLYDPWKCLKN